MQTKFEELAERLKKIKGEVSYHSIMFSQDTQLIMISYYLPYDRDVQTFTTFYSDEMDLDDLILNFKMAVDCRLAEMWLHIQDVATGFRRTRI